MQCRAEKILQSKALCYNEVAVARRDVLKSNRNEFHIPHAHPGDGKAVKRLRAALMNLCAMNLGDLFSVPFSLFLGIHLVYWNWKVYKSGREQCERLSMLLCSAEEFFSSLRWIGVPHYAVVFAYTAETDDGYSKRAFVHSSPLTRNPLDVHQSKAIFPAREKSPA